MTQEEKAKRFDEAVKEASIAYKDEDRHLKATLERIFPELKESEDKRIRKALIDYFDDANKADENPLQNYGIHTDKVIYWLKSLKQHHHWIPTKRQMECFEDFLLHIPSTNPNKMCLAGIYEELKNLT